MLKNKNVIASIILTAVMMLPYAPAYADMMVYTLTTAPTTAAPADNFFAAHSSECVSYYRQFLYFNGEKGRALLYDEPGSKTISYAVLNNTTTDSISVYNYKGEAWGYVNFSAQTSPYNGKTVYGWVPMKDMLVDYDYISFFNEHKKDFGPYFTSSTAYSDMLKNDEVIAWAWPGSGVINGTVKTNYIEGFGLTQPYTDADGRVWGFAMPSWVCVSDPLNENIPAFNPPTAPRPWAVDTKTGGGLLLPAAVIILVCAVVIVTAALIRLLYKKSV